MRQNAEVENDERPATKIAESDEREKQRCSTRQAHPMWYEFASN